MNCLFWGYSKYHFLKGPGVTHVYCLLFRIVHYEQRLKSLFYKKRFPERMGEVKPRVQGLFLCMHFFRSVCTEECFRVS